MAPLQIPARKAITSPEPESARTLPPSSGTESDIEEGRDSYRPGGIHPVYIGGIYAEKYKVLNKIGYAWGKQGIREALLAIYKDFDPNVGALLQLVDESTLNDWQLLDMDRMPCLAKDRLALLGDAAHPFLPRQGEAIAIEDAASICPLLPRGTPSPAIPDRRKAVSKDSKL